MSGPATLTGIGVCALCYYIAHRLDRARPYSVTAYFLACSSVWAAAAFAWLWVIQW